MSHSAKKNRHLGRNLIALTQLILAALVVLFLALALKGVAPRLDLTTLKSYSLSDYTQKLLKSEQLENYPIHLTCLANQNTSYYARVKTMLNEYERLSGKQITVEYCDPLSHPQRAYKITEKYKLKPTEDLLILDNGKEKGVSIIPFSDLLLHEVTPQKQRVLSGYQVEDAVTTAILNLVEEKVRRVYLVSNNTQAQNLRPGSIGETLQSLYRNQNIDLQPLSLSGLDRLPADTAGLLFLTPQYDLEPAEMELLVSYWNTPKASLLFILEPENKPKRLRAFMRLHGVTQRNDRIFTQEPAELSSKTIATFTQGSQLNDLLQGKSTIFDGVSSSLEVREAAEDLMNKRIAPIPLIKVSENHYSESRPEEKNPSYNEEEDLRKSLYLGASVIKGNEMSDETVNFSSRMVILSTSDFLKSNTIRDEQIDFMKNTINWLVGRTELIGIGPKPLKQYKLNLVSSEISFMNNLTLFFLPVFFLLIAAFIWNLKRH